MQPSGSYDLIRTARMASFGLIFLGPSQHLWFSYLSRILPKRDVLTTFKKIMMGQVLFGPCSNTVFYSYNAALQGNILLFISAYMGLIQVSFVSKMDLAWFLVFRWKLWGDSGETEARSCANVEKWTFVLASLRFCYVQVCACSSTGKSVHSILLLVFFFFNFNMWNLLVAATDE